MLEKVLSHAMLKAKPNIELRISLIMTNLQPSTQKIEPLGMLKQSLILLNK
ncbi:hypothetical protein Goshw_004218 [Gossypium schwendimanii]|uniref:Uncharacterized protein n=1 Tax=Gossypium schwendimanii TaxID=34291 RepID=A0A7J9NAI6_GOSSC|nr:hypothetical protein [Gossypium schwendimanii]